MKDRDFSIENEKITAAEGDGNLEWRMDDSIWCKWELYTINSNTMKRAKMFKYLK